MTKETKTISGIILISIVTIAYGGYFLLGLLSGQYEEMQLTEFQKAMFRAGHAHAGVLVILSLVAQLFVDQTSLTGLWRWTARLGIPLAAIFISGGFFASATGSGLTQPNGLIVILYVGVVFLVAGLVSLGIGLLRK